MIEQLPVLTSGLTPAPIDAGEQRFVDDCGNRIQPRDGVNPEDGVRQYGEVTFADPVNNKYPVATPAYIHAAWSYIHHERDAAFYSAEDVACIERRIREAAAEVGITLGS